MENDKICVFCGQKPGPFRNGSVFCGGVWQFSCKACEKELKDADDLEKCQRALRFGFAEKPERLKERIEVITEAENHRPTCVHCGGKLVFGSVKTLDSSPMRDGIFADTFDVLPAYCEGCGKIEFYDPTYARRNKYMAYLIRKDTQE